jgi:hypothetical protein
MLQAEIHELFTIEEFANGKVCKLEIGLDLANLLSDQAAAEIGNGALSDDITWTENACLG